jgi:predicted dehydrogenase
VVKQNRLNATMQLLKQAVDGGRFGRIFLVNVNVFWTRSQSYYDKAPWRGRWDLDGGAFLNQASHYVDMVDWLAGPVDNVHAYTATHWQFDETRPEDEAVTGANYAPPFVYGYGHPLYYANVIDTLRGQAHAEVDGYEGLRSLEVVIAAYRSGARRC